MLTPGGQKRRNVDYSPTGITTPSLLTSVIIEVFSAAILRYVWGCDLGWERFVMGRRRAELWKWLSSCVFYECGRERMKEELKDEAYEYLDRKFVCSLEIGS